MTRAPTPLQAARASVGKQASCTPDADNFNLALFNQVLLPKLTASIPLLSCSRQGAYTAECLAYSDVIIVPSSASRCFTFSAALRSLCPN
jgi:hypothetical protein